MSQGTLRDKGTLRDIKGLEAAGLLQEPPETLAAVVARYAVAVTPEMAALIDPASAEDPIARQFIPSLAELETTPNELTDPIGDTAHSPVEGIVHRYPDRVLLKLLHVCPVYCRFCFRREVVGPGAESVLPEAKAAAALDYIARHPAIWEVILTGGDPFLLGARRMGEITQALDQMGHVKIVRWHTRVPVVDSARVTLALVAALRAERLTTVVGIHANHPREFTPAACAALARLANAGIMLVSQTVLLKGVNDDVETMAALMRRFVENRVKPYYLHHADLAPGTSHFRTSVAEGQVLMRALRGHISGLCLPTYVVDIPGGHGKVPAGLGYMAEGTIEDYRGGLHAYPPGGLQD